MLDFSNFTPPNGKKKDIQLMAIFGVIAILALCSLIVEGVQQVRMWIVIAVCVIAFYASARDYFIEVKKEAAATKTDEDK